jgi:hypothetical protein
MGLRRMTTRGIMVALAAVPGFRLSLNRTHDFHLSWKGIG